MEFRRTTCVALFLTASVLTVAQAWAQVKPGSVVEAVAKNSEAEKAGLQEGDLLLGWSRGNDQGEIISPFDLSLIEIEQAPLGKVTLEGIRGTEDRTWIIGPDTWGITARPNLPPDSLSIYLDGQQLAKAGKLSAAARRWKQAVTVTSASWLKAWFLFHAAEQFGKIRRWREADENYQQAVKKAGAAGPDVLALVFGAWADNCNQRSDQRDVAKHRLLALENSRKSGPESLLTAFMLNKAAGGLFGAMAAPANAKEYHDQALNIQRKLAPNSLALAETLTNGGIILLWASDFKGAENEAQEALAIEEQLAPASLKYAASLLALSIAEFYTGELAKVEEHQKSAVEIQQKLAPGSLDLSSTLNNLGNTFAMQGEFPKAEAYYLEALAIRQKILPNSFRVAGTLANVAAVAWNQGDLTRAERCYRQALAIQEKLGLAGATAANILTSLGRISQELGDDKRAEQYFRRAQAAWRTWSGPGKEFADSLEAVGQFYKWRGDLAQAEQYYARALKIREKEAPDSPDIAESLLHSGELAEDRKQFAKAEGYYRQSLAIRAKQMPGSRFHAESLAALARIKNRQEQTEDAAQLYQQALDALEGQTARLGGTEEVRSKFRAKYASYYQEYIDLLMKQGKPELAFHILERQRARTLLETLAAAHVDIRKGVSPTLVETERELQQEFSVQSQARIQLLSSKHTEKQVEDLGRRIKDILDQYYSVEEQMRANSPAYAALTQPQPLRANEVQQKLLDPDSLLLEYSLGEEHSYVFAVTPDSLTAYQLPKRIEVEALARKVYHFLIVRSYIRSSETMLQRKTRILRADAAYAKAVTELGRLLLAPVNAQMGGKRLLIVSDGALQYVPFSILPDPGSSAAHPVPLIFSHEIVNLPSASVLEVLRRQEAEHKPAKAVAVLADPVFTSRDARVQAQRTASLEKERSESKMKDVVASDFSQDLLTRSARDIGFLSLPRLPFTRQEADAILAVTPTGEGLKAVDFQANRELSMSPDLANYRIVHLATHGLVDSEHPELSGLVLSLVDQQGRRQNGFLGLEDIYNLDLPVEMVVLSACDTGLGKEISGEGLIGLTRGFMYAGAKRVVASLWSVDDVATAELMGRFYKGMLQEGQSPSAALRQAQVEMWKQKRWHDPYYWGAFVLQGEWKPQNGQGTN